MVLSRGSPKVEVQIEERKVRCADLRFPVVVSNSRFGVEDDPKLVHQIGLGFFWCAH